MNTKINREVLNRIENALHQEQREVETQGKVYSLPKLEGWKAKVPKPKEKEIQTKALQVYARVR